MTHYMRDLSDEIVGHIVSLGEKERYGEIDSLALKSNLNRNQCHGIGLLCNQGYSSGGASSGGGGGSSGGGGSGVGVGGISARGIAMTY